MSRMQVVRMLAVIVGVGLSIGPRPAQALVIQVLSSFSSVESQTNNGSVGTNIYAFPTTGSFTATGIENVAGNRAYTAYDLSTSGFLTSFEVAALTDVDTQTQGYAASSLAIWFTVDRDVQYSWTDSFVYSAAVPGQDEALLSVHLEDGTHGGQLFGMSLDSNYPFQTDGSPVGTLHPGILYQYGTYALLDTGLSGSLSLSASGDTGLHLLPEPSLGGLLGGASAAWLLARRRGAYGVKASAGAC